MINTKWILFLFVIILLPVQSVSAISNVQHFVDGNKVTITYQGTPPFWINIRGDTNIGQDGGYLWAKTYSNSFFYDMSFAINPSKKFYYGVKDTSWSSTNSFTLQTNSVCKNNDYYCPWECNDWKLDKDCGAPQIYDLIESRKPNDYLTSDMIHWSDEDWKTYPPLVNKVNEIITGINSDFEKAKVIANWVQTSKPYGFPSPANEGKSVIEIFNSDTGVCMDAAILTAAMSRMAGIPSRTIPISGHEYTESYIDGRWVGFDATFGSGGARIIDPVTAILYNNEYYASEPKYISIFSDGTPREITDISYYKVNIIPRDIYKSAETKLIITWNLNTDEEVKEKYCELSSFKTGQLERFDNSPILKTISIDDNTYFLNCVVTLQSDQDTEHTEQIRIIFTGTKIETTNTLPSEYFNIDVETASIKNTPAGWGIVYIPSTSMVVFKNKDDTYSLTYDKEKYSDFTGILWFIKSDNLKCDNYRCHYVNNNEYSQYIAPPAILGYGSLRIGDNPVIMGMPPDHHNGFIKITLPEGKYKLIYLFDEDVGYKYFEVLPNQKQIIYSEEISKYDSSAQNKFTILKTALTKSIEGLNP